MNHDHDTATPEPMTAPERDLKAAHFRDWLEAQARERREKTEVRAALAYAEYRLDCLDLRVSALGGPPIPERD